MSVLNEIIYFKIKSEAHIITWESQHREADGKKEEPGLKKTLPERDRTGRAGQRATKTEKVNSDLPPVSRCVLTWPPTSFTSALGTLAK